MVKALFTNTNCSVNKGSAAQVISTCETLRALIPNLDITLISRYPEHDTELCSSYDINVVSAMWLRLPQIRICRGFYYKIVHSYGNALWAILLRIGLNPKAVKSPIIQEYASADVIIDLSGDSFSDGKGGSSIATDTSILLGLSSKKPLVIYSQSVGPFKRSVSFLARYCLNKSNLIIVREEITRDYLYDLGIRPTIHLTTDCAFLLKPATCERVNEILSKEGVDTSKRPLIGVSANAMLNDTEGNYARLMAQLIDYIIEKLDAYVVFVPHVVSLIAYGKGDDRVMGEQIYNIIRNKSNVKLIEGDYSPGDLKAIIGMCDLFIGGRMHANIAAVSSCVPTIATAWSHKYYGIMRTLGQEKYVCDFKTMNFEELRSKVDDLWDCKESIINELKINVETQKRLAWHSGELVRGLLSSD